MKGGQTFTSNGLNGVDAQFARNVRRDHREGCPRVGQKPVSGDVVEQARNEEHAAVGALPDDSITAPTHNATFRSSGIASPA